MALEQELKTYHDQMPSLEKDEGKFVLIHGSDIIGTFESREAAMVLGYERFKLNPFLVKRIQKVERPLCITRRILPTPCQ